MCFYFSLYACFCIGELENDSIRCCEAVPIVILMKCYHYSNIQTNNNNDDDDFNYDNTGVHNRNTVNIF